MVVLGLVFSFGYEATAGDAGARIGAGAHYWAYMDDIDIDNVDDDGFSYMLSLQYDTGTLLKFEANLEIYPEGLTGTDENVYAPQAYVLLGGFIYAGLGVGIGYYDGNLADDPFYVLRGGLDLELLPRIHLDINANYHFTDIGAIDDAIDNIDSDTLTIGGMVRIEL
ncbi:hypothetical protein BVX97_04180 [bacterium E08(2017)]|nr:hypothetical protein BVX97_04180 [bacterium E08(2017)]